MQSASYYLSDYNIVAFPKLSMEFNISPTAFTVFGFEIKWYGILIALGMLLALIYCFKRVREFGLDGDRVVDAVLVGLIAAMAGARAYYILFDPDKTFRDFFSIRDGGLAIYGGLIGAIVFGAIMAKIRKVKIATLMDLASLGFLIGQAVGRWGNFVNKEAFGSETTLPWGMASGSVQNALSALYDGPAKLAHPCFLYESLWCVLGFLLLHWFSKRRTFDGQIFLMYGVWYGLGRFFIEGLRMDSLYIGELRASQLLSGLIVVTAGVVLIILSSKAKRGDMPDLYCTTDASKALLDEADLRLAEEEEKSRARKEKRKGGKAEAQQESEIQETEISETPEKDPEEESENG